MQRQRRWNIAPPHPAAADLASRLKTSPLIGQILLNRGLTEPDACQAFLRPVLAQLHPPEQLAGLTRAAERIARAIRDGEKIVIYGDYDVDGITATSILWHAIRTLGGTVDYYIPNRIDEGYGLNSEAVRQVCDQGAKLIITVDCGITAVEQAKVAAEKGVDLIITDHHEWHEGEQHGDGADASAAASAPHLPDCFVIVHPRLPLDGIAYPNPVLCGAGVAYKLAWGVGVAVCGSRKVSDEFRKFLLDATALTALGTVADVVPLVGENRSVTHFGLGGLKKSTLVGIRALIASAGLTGQNLDSFDVGFKLAPRLNACGRMGHAALAVEMLTTADEARAAEIATFLEGQNRQRQSIEKKILEQAFAQVAELKMDGDGQCGIVLGHEQWHPGVIGIVASRIVDKFHRPAVMVALQNGHGQGSGRSISGFHLAKALHACSRHLESHGGHEMAAGLKVRSENFESFRQSFCEHAAAVLKPEQLVPELKLDAVAELSQFTEALVHDLQRLGPFGHGNRKPVLCCRGVEVATSRRVGQAGDHLQLHVRQGNTMIRGIAFGYGPMDSRLGPGTAVDLAVEPRINEFNGRRNVELEVKDVQFPKEG
jgi:single-stranded-DNA-specific exonuclease